MGRQGKIYSSQICKMHCLFLSSITKIVSKTVIAFEVVKVPPQQGWAAFSVWTAFLQLWFALDVASSFQLVRSHDAVLQPTAGFWDEMKVEELCVQLGYQHVCWPLDCVCWGKPALCIYWHSSGLKGKQTQILTVRLVVAVAGKPLTNKMLYYGEATSLAPNPLSLSCSVCWKPLGSYLGAIYGEQADAPALLWAVQCFLGFLAQDFWWKGFLT